MAKIIRYKLSRSTFTTKDGRPTYSAAVQHNGTLGEDAFYEKVSQSCGMKSAVVKSTVSVCFDQMREELQNGNRVELSWLSAFLSLPGNFASTTPESRRAAGARLVAHISAKGKFKNCCAGEEFVLENVTQGATVIIRGVSDMVSAQDDVLTRGTDVEVHVVGTGFYMPDTSDPSVGVWLEDADGTACARAKVTESTSTTLVCVFDEIDGAEGTYKLCVASRDGMDPEQYGVTVARRNVTVVNAEASGEEAQNG